MRDAFNLQRFLDAQSQSFEGVRTELMNGRKVGHWIWFIFPQLKGLGVSSTSEFYGISGADEAMAYLRHPLLGPRLEECTRLVIKVDGKSLGDILGGIDAMKFRSSMTLFSAVNPENGLFAEALEKYFDGDPDQFTLSLLKAG